ncbi:MAG TPA: hypothetical protein VM223_13800 [Planctomycetota bacterium]|nr:hypothetical protein [Planctomycetota bacterium]
MTTKRSQPKLAELAALEEVIVGLRGCVDDQGEKIKVLAAAVEQSQQLNQALAEHLDDARERERALEAELSRLRRLEQAAKALYLYIPGALDELLDDSDGHFARDAVAEALVAAREALEAKL